MRNITRLLLTGLVLGLLVFAGCQQEAPSDDMMNESSMMSEDNNMEEEMSDVQEVQVALTDESLSLEPESVQAGEVMFAISNDGELYNEFAVEANGETYTVEGGIDAGATAELTVELDSGEYKAFSPIPGREEKGLVAQLSVE